MRTRVVNTPMGRWLVERGLEAHVPPMGYCTACGRGFFNETPSGKRLTYCGCLGVDLPARRVPRLFCPSCGHGQRCRCQR